MPGEELCEGLPAPSFLPNSFLHLFKSNASFEADATAVLWSQLSLSVRLTRLVVEPSLLPAGHGVKKLDPPCDSSVRPLCLSPSRPHPGTQALSMPLAVALRKPRGATSLLEHLAGSPWCSGRSTISAGAAGLPVDRACSRSPRPWHGLKFALPLQLLVKSGHFLWI